MSKPWDKLRDKVAKPPMYPGRWDTSISKAWVHLHGVCDKQSHIGIGISDSSQVFGAADLRELAEFCNELADQLDGK